MPSTLTAQAELDGITGDPVIRLCEDGIDLPLIDLGGGRWAAEIPRTAIPTVGIVRFMNTGGNDWKPVLKTTSRWIRTTKLAELIDMEIDSNTLIRLWKNGFITCTQPAPHSIFLDLVSFFRHLEEAKDPDYWTADRRSNYKSAVY